jgi:hypothetical protein
MFMWKMIPSRRGRGPLYPGVESDLDQWVGGEG